MITVYGLNVQAFQASRPSRFFDLMREQQPDVICLQETGCEPRDIPIYARLAGYQISGNYGAPGPGRTGVAILSKRPQTSISKKVCRGDEHDACRGRFVETTINSLKFASVYAHAHDPKSADRRQARIQLNECIKSYMIAGFEKPTIISLDANVALSREDVNNDTQFSGPWASRTYRDSYVSAMEKGRWVDSYRAIHGRRRRATVWTSTNYKDPVEMGYGIDFQFVSQPIATSVQEAEVLKPLTWEARYSDHAVTFGRYDIN